MNLLVIVFALVAHNCGAFVVPVESLKISTPSMNSRWSMKKAVEVVGKSMGKAKATKDTAKMVRKPQVVAEMMERAGLNKTQAEAAVVAFTETIVDFVSDGNKINLQGFGTFESRQRAGRQGRNPRTGEPIEIKATTVPAFSASKNFKEQVKTKHIG